MMNRFVFFSLLLASGFSAASAETLSPETAPVVSATLSIWDAVKLALNRNPDELDYRERIVEDKANKALAVSQLFPTITGLASAATQKDPVSAGNAQFEGNSYDNYIAQLKLVQPLYEGGALLSGLSYANKDIDIRKLDLDVTERGIIASVIQQFYAVFTNKEVNTILQKTQAVEKESLSTAQRYYKIGRGQLIDVLQIKVQIAQLNPQIQTADNQMKSAASQLTALLHESQTTSLNLVGSLATIDPTTIRGLDSTKKKLPEITRGELQISQFHDKIDVSLAQYFPSLNLQGTYGQQSTIRSELFSDYSTGWTVGLFLTIPIFNGLASIHERHALNSQVMQLEYGQQKLLDTLSYNETQADRDFDTAVTVVGSSKEAADFAKESLKEAQRDFRLQTINYLQLLTSQQNYLSTELTYIQAKGSYINTLAEYCVSKGIPIEKLVDILDAQKDAPDTL
jgi:outer membrane protein TolC